MGMTTKPCSEFIGINKAAADVINHPASNICKESGKRPDAEMGTKGEVKKDTSSRELWSIENRESKILKGRPGIKTEGEGKRDEAEQRAKGSREAAAGWRGCMRRIPITSCSLLKNNNDTLGTESKFTCVLLHVIRGRYCVFISVCPSATCVIRPVCAFEACVSTFSVDCDAALLAPVRSHCWTVKLLRNADEQRDERKTGRRTECFP